jgi:ATP-dependent Clp protease adaptor protein ClpS
MFLFFSKLFKTPSRINPQTNKSVETDNDIISEYSPDYKLILHDDNEHTYDYVIEMLCSVLEITPEKAFQHAFEVDHTKITVLMVSSLNVVKQRQEQILSYGPDWRLKNSNGSMKATIEKV